MKIKNQHKGGGKTTFNSMRKYRVENSTIENFIKTFYKYDRIKPTTIPSYKESLKRDGFVFISRHDSVTGEIVSYYGLV